MKKFFLSLSSLIVVLFLAGCGDSLSSKGLETGQLLETEYSWEEALIKLHNGEVKTIAQSHDLTVHFHLKSGQSFSIKEPSIDAIFDEVEKCGEACANMPMMTE